MTLLEQSAAMVRPYVRGDLPGPRSAELLARQGRRESNARVYGRHLPIAVQEAAGSFFRDVDGNVFIDFLSGAGVLSLGHNHPELVAAAIRQMQRFCHGLDLPSPAKDAFTDGAAVDAAGRDAGADAGAFLRADRSERGGRGDQALQDRDRAWGCRGFSGGFHGTTHAGMAFTGLVANKAPIGEWRARCPLLPVLELPGLSDGPDAQHVLDELRWVRRAVAA